VRTVRANKASRGCGTGRSRRRQPARDGTASALEGWIFGLGHRRGRGVGGCGRAIATQRDTLPRPRFGFVQVSAVRGLHPDRRPAEQTFQRGKGSDDEPTRRTRTAQQPQS
jgi:hypothetical protein